MIVILSNKFDLSCDYVVRYLRQNEADFVRLNTEDLINEEVTVTFSRLAIRVTNKAKELDLVGNVSSFLLRRPGKPFEFTDKKDRPTSAVTKYVENQWHTFLESFCLLGKVFWINDPLKNHIAENKILQLNLATDMGFKIPNTCITSSRKRAIAFSKSCAKGVVAKALNSPLLEKRNTDYFVYTAKISSFEFADKKYNMAPTIFQEAITKKVDYRVTVIGSKCFAVKIQSASILPVPLDWRSAQNRLLYTPVSLPDEISNKCIKMVKNLGLVFGAIDLLESNGEFFFLEINPNGEWGWLQKDANLPIAECLGELLIRGGQ